VQQKSDGKMPAATVVLFKADDAVNQAAGAAEDDDDPYKSALFGRGFDDVRVIPAIAFNFVNLEELAEKLERPGDYAGLIFTSPR
jgi:hypothetical protein